jgi:two-component system, OmpR family, phosphate regulon sensor histidine kinase PhoR
MADAENRGASPVAFYRLAFDEPAPVSEPGVSAAVIDAPLLQENAVWFCRLRWGVIALLAAVGAVTAVGLPVERTGLQLAPASPLLSAGILAALNLVYLFLLPGEASPLRMARLRVHLWMQIVVDLAVLTVVIHFLGSVETPAVFMYLFHIILACIFFPPWQSLAVTATSAAFYLACLAVESCGWLPPATVLVQPGLVERSQLLPSFWLTHLGLTFLIWGVIWYLASRLAGAVRQHELDLAQANARLRASSDERAQHMLETTHQLKAPFAAIHANTQLLLRGSCGELPEAAHAVVERIAARCATLSQQVIDMLQLANLRSASQAAPSPTDLDLATFLEGCIARYESAAAQRGVRIRADLEPFVLRAVEDHLKMLLDNVLSNAVNYSYPDGEVKLTCRPHTEATAVVVVRDHGIGIPAEKLPNIFHDYYRTTEAARHNKESTGLGLAIVRHVARQAGIQVLVASGPGWGTQVTLTIPRSPPASPGSP